MRWSQSTGRALKMTMGIQHPRQRIKASTITVKKAEEFLAAIPDRPESLLATNFNSLFFAIKPFAE